MAITENPCSGSKDDIVQLYSAVFADEVGILEGRLHLEIDKDVQLVQLRVCRIPNAMQEKSGKELDRLNKEPLNHWKSACPH